MTAEQQERAANGAAPEVADRLKEEIQHLLGALADRRLAAAQDRLGGLAERLTEYAEQSGGPGLLAAVTGATSLSEGKSPMRAMFSAGLAGAKQKLGGQSGQGGQGDALKVTNIIESIDVGVPVRLAYNQWTQFSQFPSFMQKAENVEQQEDAKLNWKAQVFWSHRNWEATILQQIPDQEIIWRSTGAKGHVGGAVTFHELAPRLTRILVVLEYFPPGLFEKTGNIWRAQGRRVRLELKHYRRHVMSHVLLNPDEVTGWRGVIEDGEVVQDHESRVREEREAEGADDQENADDYGDQDEAEPYDEDEEDDEDDEDGQDEDEDGEPFDEEEPAAYDGGAADDEAYDNDDEDYDEEPEPVAAGRRRR